MTSQPVTNISWRHKIFDGMVFMFIKLFDIDGDQTWRWVRRLLNHLGFYWVHHRSALTVWRRGRFLYALEEQREHNWHPLRGSAQHEEVGPEFDLKSTLIPVQYDNVPTTLGPGLGRPISVSLKLMFAFVFEPHLQSEANPDFVERQILGGPKLREETVRKLARSEVEKIIGSLSPIDVRLRWADQHIIERLQVNLNNVLKSVAIRITAIIIDEVILPKELETEIVANHELLRQSIERYTPVELARIAVTKMSQGWATNPPIAEVDVNPVVRLGMSEEHAPIIDVSGPSGGLQSPPSPPPEAPKPSPLPRDEAPEPLKRQPPKRR